MAFVYLFHIADCDREHLPYSLLRQHHFLHTFISILRHPNRHIIESALYLPWFAREEMTVGEEFRTVSSYELDKISAPPVLAVLRHLHGIHCPYAIHRLLTCYMMMQGIGFESSLHPLLE